jgi:Secretion system C-terminal sorting domain
MRNFTFAKGITLLSLILILSFATNAQNNQGGSQGQNGQGQNGQNYNVNFSTSPQLISSVNGDSLAVGAVYKFANIASGTYAKVTIMSATGGATVVMLDDNDLTKPEAFSPRINIPAYSTGMVEFKIEFFKTSNNSVKLLDTLRATAMDIDGSPDLHEMDALDLGAGSVLSYQSNNLEIAVTQTGNLYTAVNVAGIEYTAVDTAAKQVMFTLTKSLISQFTYKAGANNNFSIPVARQKGIYFKGFNYAAAIVLPVKLLSFDAVVLDKSVLLNWKTSEEINHNYFEVERSIDGNSFSKTAIVLDGMANGTAKNYELKDDVSLLQEKAVLYYRLKQVSKDGSFTYSNILSVRFKNVSDVVMQVSPNPFVERLTARFNSNEKANAQISITNINGKTVVVKQSNISKGFNNVQIDGLASLPAGLYVASLVVNGKVIDSQTIVK